MLNENDFRKTFTTRLVLIQRVKLANEILVLSLQNAKKRFCQLKIKLSAKDNVKFLNLLLLFVKN